MSVWLDRLDRNAPVTTTFLLKIAGFAGITYCVASKVLNHCRVPLLFDARDASNNFFAGEVVQFKIEDDESGRAITSMRRFLQQQAYLRCKV